MIIHKEILMAWAIMPRCGMNLENYFEMMDHKMSKNSVYDAGTAILSMLEATHKAGYVFNDLKLDNVMVGYGQRLSKKITTESVFSNCTLHLIDFGFATKYKDRKGVHNPKVQIDKFRGNMIFASRNQLQFYATSRRDDLISLCYVLIYLLNEGSLLTIFADSTNCDPRQAFKIAL
jgi:serine/threonine protein kinase